MQGRATFTKRNRRPAPTKIAGVGSPRRAKAKYCAVSQAFTRKRRYCTVSHFVSLQEDITARKQTELRISESESRFRAIFDNSPDGIALLKESRSYSARVSCRTRGRLWPNFPPLQCPSQKFKS